MVRSINGNHYYFYFGIFNTIIMSASTGVTSAIPPHHSQSLKVFLKRVQSNAAALPEPEVRFESFFCNGATFHMNAIPEIENKISDQSIQPVRINGTSPARAVKIPAAVIKITPGMVKYLSLNITPLIE